MAEDKKVSLKMVTGERYACPKMGNDIVVVGQTIEVTQEVADILLADSWKDIAGNEHAYFEEVDASAEGEGKPVKAATRTRPGK